MTIINIVLCFLVASATGFSIKNDFGLHEDVQPTQVCEFFEKNNNCSEIQPECFQKKICDTYKRHHCFAVWSLSDEKNKPLLLWKGCFPAADQDKYYKKPFCSEVSATNPLRYKCYCDGDMCNHNMTWTPQLKPSTTSSIPPTEPSIQQAQLILISRFTIALGVIISSILILFCFHLCQGKLKVYHEKKNKGDEKKKVVEIVELPKIPMDLETIKKIQIIGRGRYGTVWKGHFKTNIIAIKITSEQSKDTWENELSTFKTPQLEHENILYFIGGNHYLNDAKPEYWLITDYHEKGSIHDYLKNNIISLRDLKRIIESMMRGLRHLHGEIPGNMAYGYKPSIAHRDFKSQNVLLKSDMTACIADLGFAIKFQPGNICSNIHAQVGTPRYMAPEVLDGAINFTRDSFLRIDMYACGLVIWELLSRCNVLDVPVEAYKQPFEVEAGLYPNYLTMQKIVSEKKMRPLIPDFWRKHPLLETYCDIIEECWDDDADARISAPCIVERLTNL